MNVLKNFKIGPRVLKTSLSAGISMFIVQISGLEYPALAVVAAIITLQPTVHETVDMSKRRLGGTIVGCILGVMFAALVPDNPIIMSIGIMIVFTICNFFNWQSASALACVVFASIITTAGGSTAAIGINRVINTFIGISVSLVINWIIPAAPVDKYASYSLQRVFSKILLLFRKGLEQFTSGVINQKELNALKDDISVFFEKADEATENFKKEIKYVKLDTNKLDYCEKNYKTLWNAYIYTAQIVNDITMNESHDLLNKEINSKLKNIVMLLRKIEPVLIMQMNNIPEDIFHEINENVDFILALLEKKKDELLAEYTMEHISYFLNIITNIQIVIMEFTQISGDNDNNEKNCSRVY